MQQAGNFKKKKKKVLYTETEFLSGHLSNHQIQPGSDTTRSLLGDFATTFSYSFLHKFC